MPSVRTTSGKPPSARKSRVAAVNSAVQGQEAVAQATERMLDVVNDLDDTLTRGPSRLPGWTRAHVVTHLARGADALLNLMLWAKTGVEHPAYASRADRDADIELGAGRPWWLLNEDLRAASERFAAFAREMPAPAWEAEVSTATGFEMRASHVPWLRLREIWMHLVDLDHGVTLADIPQPHLEALLDDVTTYFVTHPDMSPVVLEVELPDGGRRVFELGTGNDTLVSTTVCGTAVDALSWLTGRDSGSRLTKPLPVLPAWL